MTGEQLPLASMGLVTELRLLRVLRFRVAQRRGWPGWLAVPPGGADG